MKYQRTILSREMTRAYGMDHPIGDPFGGPAYGKKDDPVSIVVGAISVIGGMGVGGLIGGLMIAGGVLQIAGGITGNENLTKLGGLVSLVGGVAGFATGAINMGSLFGGGGEAATGVVAEQAAAPVADAAITSVEGVSSAAAPSANGIVNTPATGWDSLTQTGSADSFAQTGLYDTSNTGSNFYQGANGAQLGSGTGLDLAKIQAITTTPAETGAKSLFGDIAGMWKDADPLTKYGMMQAGSGMLNSFASAPSEEQESQQMDMLKAQEEQIKANTALTATKQQELLLAIEREKQRIANKQYTMNQGMLPTANTSSSNLNIPTLQRA